MFESGTTATGPGPEGMQRVLALRDRLQRDFAANTSASLSEQVIDRANAVEAAEVALVQTIAEWDAKQTWAQDHALSPVPWLAQRTTRSRADAGRLVRSARLVHHVPAVADALASGQLSTTKLDLLAGAAGQGRASLFGEHADTLLGFANDLNVHDFTLSLIHI